MAESEVPASHALRRGLFHALQSLRAGRHDEAVHTLEGLREACARAGDTTGELGVTLTLAGVLGASRKHALAAATYRAAASLAVLCALPGVECQTLLGEGGSWLAAESYEEAANVYGRAATKAREAGIDALADQAGRMERASRVMLSGSSKASSTVAQECAASHAPPADAVEGTGVAQANPAVGTLPFVRKDVDPMSLGPSTASAGSKGHDTGTLELRAIPLASVLPFQGPRVEVAKASFMRAAAEPGASAPDAFKA